MRPETLLDRACVTPAQRAHGSPRARQRPGCCAPGGRKRWGGTSASLTLSRIRMASRSGDRLTPSKATSSRSRIRSPGFRRPATIASRRASTTRSRMSPGSEKWMRGSTSWCAERDLPDPVRSAICRSESVTSRAPLATGAHVAAVTSSRLTAGRLYTGSCRSRSGSLRSVSGGWSLPLTEEAYLPASSVLASSLRPILFSRRSERSRTRSLPRISTNVVPMVTPMRMQKKRARPAAIASPCRAKAASGASRLRVATANVYCSTPP
jgi:hypothetical protein